MPPSAWRGYISFGLITMPIRLYPAARESRVAFHEIHKECGTRIHHQLYCPYDERVVSRDEVAMGYEVAKDKYVLVDKAELKKLQPKSSSTMEIIEFVKLSEVDPIYFETSYFAVPEEAGARAYSLLLKTMSQMRFAAIAKVTMHLRERTVIMRPYDNGLTLHTIYYQNEIREVKDYGKYVAKDLKKQEIALAEQFAKALARPFRPEQFKDEYQERLKQLVERKADGKPIPAPEKSPRLAPVIDLMSALKKSLAAENKSAGASKGKRLKKTA
ncbi:MAG: Ku protein [Candidatus Acidiferrum sp.]